MTSDSVVLFLDIDGVLLPVSEMCMGGGDLEDDCLSCFRKMVELLEAPPLIVLSSTWRNSEDKKKRLNDAFSRLAIPSVHSGVPNGVANPTVVSYLEEDPSEQRLVRDRVDEIQQWVEDHASEYPFARAGRWIAIDDMDLSYDTRMDGHFLKTTTDEGLQRSHVIKFEELVKALPHVDQHAASQHPGGESHHSKLPLDVELEGAVKSYSYKRGFGFIKCQGEEVFVHQTEIEQSGFRGLNDDAPVKFKIAIGSDGRRQAVKVQQLTPFKRLDAQLHSSQQFDVMGMGTVPAPYMFNPWMWSMPTMMMPPWAPPPQPSGPRKLAPKQSQTDADAVHAPAPITTNNSANTDPSNNIPNVRPSKPSSHQSSDLPPPQFFRYLPEGVGWRSGDGTVYFNHPTQPVDRATPASPPTASTGKAPAPGGKRARRGGK